MSTAMDELVEVVEVRPGEWSIFLRDVVLVRGFESPESAREFAGGIRTEWAPGALRFDGGWWYLPPKLRDAPAE